MIVSHDDIKMNSEKLKQSLSEEHRIIWKKFKHF
jgi:hypothetical protein